MSGAGDRRREARRWIERLVQELGRADAYPDDVDGPADAVELIQTHISVVALVGSRVYKVKKPLDLAFLDFTTLERRAHFCREEVRLNRRLAPDVYLGVVPVAETPSGLRVEGEGEPVEYAVKMRRLPSEARLRERVRREEVDAATLASIGRRIAAFHASAEAGADIARNGRFDVVARQARENLEQSRWQAPRLVPPAVLGALGTALERRLDELRGAIEARAAAGVPRDTHGDLHLDHVYLFPDRNPPDDLVAIDCVEFHERFRWADPVADMAFLAMDLAFEGRRDLADAFTGAYFEASADEGGRALLPFYVSYRAAVRGKVDGILAASREVTAEVREGAARRVRAYWLLALAELEDPARRAGLVLVGGLPGTGKTTLATALARRAGFRVVSSDRVRKELAGLAPDASAAAAFGRGIYTAEWNDRTYTACLERAAALLGQGERVIVDASFREDARRAAFLSAAHERGLRALLLVCTAPDTLARARIEARPKGASDADASIHDAVARAWEPPTASVVRRAWREVPTGGALEEAVECACTHLREAGLAG